MINIRHIDLDNNKENYRVVSIHDAITAYQEGKTVGFIDEYSYRNTKIVIMDSKNTFATTFDLLINAKWAVLEEDVIDG